MLFQHETETYELFIWVIWIKELMVWPQCKAICKNMVNNHKWLLTITSSHYKSSVSSDWSLLPSKAVAMNQTLYRSMAVNIENLCCFKVSHLDTDTHFSPDTVGTDVCHHAWTDRGQAKVSRLQTSDVCPNVGFYDLFDQDAVVWFSLRSWLPGAVRVSSSVKRGFLWSGPSGQASLCHRHQPMQSLPETYSPFFWSSL